MVAAVKRLAARHPRLRMFVEKAMEDNLGTLASVVAWAVLTSVVPIVAALVAISGLILRDPAAQQGVIAHLNQALQNVLTPADIRGMVRIAVQHRGLLGMIGFVGILWGGSNVGGAISTVFLPIFQVRRRALLHEKLIDVGMTFLFSFLMLVIVFVNSAVVLLDRMFSNFPLSGVTSFLVGTGISLAAAFLLFLSIYVVFPNVEPRFRLANVWRGAALAAVLLQILSYMFPLYGIFFHLRLYGAVLGPVLVLGTWIYFFSVILLLGAEVVAFDAPHQAQREGASVGSLPGGRVPQRIPAAVEEAGYRAF